jgi:site-specific recombinase XerD
VLTRAKADALIAACPVTSPTGIRNRSLLTVLHRDGLWISEALALRAADVAPARCTVGVRANQGGKARTVGLHADAMAAVQCWADARGAAGIRRGPLFCTLVGRPVSAQYGRAMLTGVPNTYG